MTSLYMMSAGVSVLVAMRYEAGCLQLCRVEREVVHAVSAVGCGLRRSVVIVNPVSSLTFPRYPGSSLVYEYRRRLHLSYPRYNTLAIIITAHPIIADL